MKSRQKFHVLNIKGVSSERQGLIFYICRCYCDLPKPKRDMLDLLYERIGGTNQKALRAMMETDDSLSKICREHYIASETTLYRLRARFYMEFPLEELMR